ncbi:MAG: hypothetical protein ACKVP3_22140 [Hyphomicrobiaceae bacterium]
MHRLTSSVLGSPREAPRHETTDVHQWAVHHRNAADVGDGHACEWQGPLAARRSSLDRPRGAASLEDISKTLLGDIQKEQIPDAALLIARHGKIGYFEAFGYRDPATKAPMPNDAIF